MVGFALDCLKTPGVSQRCDGVARKNTTAGRVGLLWRPYLRFDGLVCMQGEDILIAGTSDRHKPKRIKSRGLCTGGGDLPYQTLVTRRTLGDYASYVRVCSVHVRRRIMSWAEGSRVMFPISDLSDAWGGVSSRPRKLVPRCFYVTFLTRKGLASRHTLREQAGHRMIPWRRPTHNAV